MTIIDLGICKWLRWNWFNHDQVEWKASTILGARFIIHMYLKILSGSEFDRARIKVIKAGLATVILITVDDYCSVTHGVLHKANKTAPTKIHTISRQSTHDTADV